METESVQIAGKDIIEYMSDMLDKNDKQEIDIERGKLNVNILKQMNNHLRYKLDVEKWRAKQAQMAIDPIIMNQK